MTRLSASEFVVGDPDTYGKVDHVTCRSRVRRNGWDPVCCGAQVPLPADGVPPQRCPLCANPLPWYGTATS
jgi:hypothetical protein